MAPKNSKENEYVYQEDAYVNEIRQALDQCRYHVSQIYTHKLPFRLNLLGIDVMLRRGLSALITLRDFKVTEFVAISISLPIL